MPQRVLLTTSASAPWHPGYPFRARGKLRKAFSILTLASLSTVIGAYFYLTDSSRVKNIAERALSDMVGGPVRVGRARLSIFEGLRLDNVSVFVDRRGLPDSRLLHAQSLHVSFSIPELIRGDLSTSTIVAVEPQVYLISDPSGASWNIQRLRPPSTTSTKPSTPTDLSKLTLPQVLLRNARITLGTLENNKVTLQDPLAIEGTLTPITRDKYNASLTARNPNSQSGSTLTGTFQLSTGQASASLRNIDLGPAFARFLPGPVREWWQRHEIAGVIEVPELTIDPATKDTPLTFRVLARFNGGALSLRPEELRPPDAEPLPAGLPSIRFSDVQGKLLFTQDGIQLQDMSLVHEGNTFKVSGSLSGYAPNSQFAIKVACDDLNLSKNPAFIPSLPPEPREVYDRFSPSGKGKFAFEVARNPDNKLTINGRLDIIDGQMAFDKFPFRCHNIAGAILVNTIEPGKTKLVVQDMRGRGRKEGGNYDADMRVQGEMFPLEGQSGVDFTITGTKVEADDELVGAMPPGVQQALKLFAGAPSRNYPVFGGSFTCKVHRDQGPVGNWRWPIDITLTHGKGAFEPFPYPLENVTGEVAIRSGYVQIKNAKTVRPGSDASLTVNGLLFYGQPKVMPENHGPLPEIPEGRLLYELDLSANSIPLDQTLLKSLPDDKQTWLTRLGLINPTDKNSPTGTLSLSGKVSGLNAAYALDVKLANATLAPAESDWSATNLAGDFQLTSTSLKIVSASAQRLGNPITATGLVDWSKGTPEIDIVAKSPKLALDEQLRSALPKEAQTGWDAVNPSGFADVAMNYSSAASGVSALSLDITPLGATIKPTLFPVTLTNVRGNVRIKEGRVTLSEITANRTPRTSTTGALPVAADDSTSAIKPSELTISGSGATTLSDPWTFKVTGKNIRIDEELRNALPLMVRQTVNSLAIEGVTDVNLRNLKIIPRKSADAAASIASVDSAANPKIATGPDVDFDLSFAPSQLAASLGVPIRATSGTIDLMGSVRNDRLAELSGELMLKTGDMAGREFSNLRTSARKSPDQPGIRFNSIGGTLADGEFAGQAAVAFPDNQPIQYALQLALRNADVQQLVGPKAEAVQGRLSASLSLEGNVDNPASRKGRGQIDVSGDRMAKVPVLLGLVQVANLSLPGNTSFNNATARYSLDGPRIIVDQLALRSPGLEMIGNGRIDLTDRDVRLTLWTAPPDLPRVPVWSDLTDPIRRELLQIQVRGTIDDPTVGASTFDSFTTTVTEVLQSGRGTGTTRKR